MKERSSGLGAADIVPALALAILGAFDLAFAEEGSFPGSPVVSAVLLAATTLPLVGRRRAPVAVLAVIALITYAWIYGAYYELDRQPPLEPGVALMVAMYSAAAYARGRGVAAAAALSLAVVAADVPRLVAGAETGETVPAWLFYLIAWAIGLGMRRRLHSEASLRERAIQIERDRERDVRDAALAERDRIARELHDVIAHRISMIVMQSSVEARMLGDRADPMHEVLTSIERSGREAMVELRRLLGVLRGPDDDGPLRPQPSLNEVDELLDRVRSAGLLVDLRVEGRARDLPAGVSLSAFRITQEALTNVAKHARATHADVTLGYREDAVEIAVVDDGESGDATAAQAGLGLVGMRERAALHGGSLEAGPREGGGFRIRAILPLGESSG